MGIFRRTDKRAIVAEGGDVVLRNRELAAALRRPEAPNFSQAPPAPCERCGQPLAEVFITTGGPLADPETWRDFPIAVDGWACPTCRDLRYPRPISPARITELANQGAAHGRAGELDAAELCFTRIVWNWPGYVVGHVNLAETARDRLQLAPADRARLVARMVEHYELAVASHRSDPTPGQAAAIARACTTLAVIAAQNGDRERARRLAGDCLALDVAAEHTAEARALLAHLDQRLDLFEAAADVLSPRIRLAGRPFQPPTAPAERKLVADAIAQLEEHLRSAPDRWQSAWLHAKALFVLGRDADGFEAYRSAFERFADQLPIGRDYSMDLLEAGRAAEAVVVCRALLAHHPDDATVWCNLAVAELLAGDLDAARRAVNASIERDPSDRIARMVLDRITRCQRDGWRPRTLRELSQG